MSKKNKAYAWQGSEEQSFPIIAQSGESGPAPGSDTFTCAVDSVSDCSRAPNPQIHIDSRLWHGIVGLCCKFNSEWLAYLIGEKNDEGNYEIKSLSFPEQVAGGTHVHNQPRTDFQVPAGVIGAIHSHVRMRAFFSSTDKAHANWPVEVVVNHKGEYEVSVRVALPCGESMRRSAKIILLTGGMLPAMEISLKEALEKGREREERERPVQAHVVWPPRDYGYMDEAFQAAPGQNERLLGGKYLTCPICQQGALVCRHSLKEMDRYEESQKGIAP